MGHYGQSPGFDASREANAHTLRLCARSAPWPFWGLRPCRWSLHCSYVWGLGCGGTPQRV